MTTTITDFPVAEEAGQGGGALDLAVPRLFIRTQRTLQVVLGLFWILDAALQYQPFMFSKQFVSTYVTANAAGQPEPVAWLITTVGHFIAPNVGVWNGYFATIQVVIGFGLLARRTVRPALAISFVWVVGVWFFGEGMSMLFTGMASALTGAPGSVFMYGMLGLMAWPRSRSDDGDAPADLGSSAAAQGIGGAITPLAVWGGFWLLSAALFLFPANRTSNSVSSAITGQASGEPSWYSLFLTHFGNAFGSIGLESTAVLATGCVIIGAGPLLCRRFTPFLWAGGLLSVAFWISGQGLGGILTGSGTDPNTGPLVVVLALAMVPTVLAGPEGWVSPMRRLAQHRPSIVLGGAVLAASALVLAATYPAAASPTGSSSSSPGMAGMSMTPAQMSPGSQTASTAHCTAGNGGVSRVGLNVTNTPAMDMGGPGTAMNMNGTDAGAAAGLNTTKTGWSYTGPELPSSEADRLLAEGSNGTGDLHMAVTGCAPDPTFSQEINAFQYVQATSAAVARYSTVSAAVAAGYEAVSPLDYPVTYFVNPAVEAANAGAKRTLDPSAIDGLVYAQLPSGQQVLAAAMYVIPASVSSPPTPYGALVQWHQRTDTCGPAASPANGDIDITGVTPCASGSVPRSTPYLTMVWQVPVAGGPLAIQPPDIQIVEAAIMSAS